MRRTLTYVAADRRRNFSHASRVGRLKEETEQGKEQGRFDAVLVYHRDLEVLHGDEFGQQKADLMQWPTEQLNGQRSAWTSANENTAREPMMKVHS